jgi:hypothetical protein
MRSYKCPINLKNTFPDKKKQSVSFGKLPLTVLSLIPQTDVIQLMMVLTEMFFSLCKKILIEYIKQYQSNSTGGIIAQQNFFQTAKNSGDKHGYNSTTGSHVPTNNAYKVT